MSGGGRAATRAAFVAAALWPIGAFAQTEELPDTFSVRPTIRTTYDTNIFKLSEEREPGDRNEWRFTPSVDFTVRQLLGGRHRLTFIGTAGYDFHPVFTFLNREKIETQGSVDVVLGKFCRVKPGIDLNFAQAQLSDQGVVVGNTERLVDYSLSFGCKRPAGLYPSISGRITRVSNSADSRREFNVDNDQVQVGVGYAVPSIGDLLVGVIYEHFDRPVLRAEGGVDARADSYRYGAQFTRAVAPRVSFRFSASYLTVDAKRPEVPFFSGLGFGAGVQVRPTPRLIIDLDLGRTPRNPSNTGSTFVLQSDARLGASIIASARSTITLGGRLMYRDFRGELLLDTDRIRDNDTTWSTFANYDYDLTQKIRLGIGARYERRTAPDSYFAYSSAAVTALIAAKL